MDKEFVDGMIIKAPRSGAPEFVKASISIKRKELGNWLRAKDDEWINLDIKESKNGKWYAEVNTWQPDAQKVAKKTSQAVSEGFDDPIPEAFDPDVPF